MSSEREITQLQFQAVCLFLASIVLGLQKLFSRLSNKTFSQPEVLPMMFREASGQEILSLIRLSYELWAM